MNSIEDRIWDYIDGLCSLEEQETISQLIANNQVYRDKYAELMDLQENLNLIDLEQPSMAFTNKVMGKIVMQTQPLSAKVRIDKRIIYGITAVFGLMLLGSLVILLKNIDWAASINIPKQLEVNFEAIENNFYLSSATKSALMYSLFLFDMIVGLMILDKILRKKLS